MRQSQSADNELCPRDGTTMEFLGYATYYDGRYSLWRCPSCSTEVGKKETL